jgi:Xaa-Pro aminopeptidase
MYESFAPIFAYGAHGATVHYSATPQSDMKLSRNNFMLIDTGGQYSFGTTDITRTLHLGTPTAQQKTDYTQVLKGHIALSKAIFPEGTRGFQLDILARQYLLQDHLNYLHGTGHGVGHCLSVHEGPQNIRANDNPTLLQPGMVTSCEPGLYRAGNYGVRIENLLLTIEDARNEFDNFYAFETLTLCPYDLNSIAPMLLTAAEIKHIDQYHARLYHTLSPYLNSKENAFLKQKTEAIKVA